MTKYRVTLDLNVRVVLDAQESVKVSDIHDKLECTLKDTTGLTDIIGTRVGDYKIVNVRPLGEASGQCNELDQLGDLYNHYREVMSREQITRYLTILQDLEEEKVPLNKDQQMALDNVFGDYKRRTDSQTNQ